MIWLIEHADGEVRITDESGEVKFHGSLRGAASHLAYMIRANQTLKDELDTSRRILQQELDAVRRHNADLANENMALKAGR